MDTQDLIATIDRAWEARADITPTTGGAVRAAVDMALDGLDRGEFRVAERSEDGWQVNQWLKKAVLLSFRLSDMVPIPGGPRDGNHGDSSWYDKVPSKFAGWDAERFAQAGFRAVPNCVVRHSAYIAPGVVLMPSFVNLGAYVDSGHHGRHLGDRRLLRPDRQELPHLRRRRHRRRARAAAGRTR